MTALFVLLTLILGIINVIDFSMAAEDADIVTQMIAKQSGAFRPEGDPPDIEMNADRFAKEGFRRMGPGSPELNFTTRYFTFKFDKEGKAENVAFNISAFTKDEAEEIARGLMDKKTGWTHTTYRFRV